MGGVPAIGAGGAGGAERRFESSNTYRPRYGSGLIEHPSEAMKELAARMDVKVDEVEAAIADGTFRQRLVEAGIEPRPGLLINRTM